MRNICVVKGEESKLREWEERSDKGRGWRLRKKAKDKRVRGWKQSRRRRRRRRRDRMRPNAGPHECFRDVVKQASSPPAY